MSKVLDLGKIEKKVLEDLQEKYAKTEIYAAWGCLKAQGVSPMKEDLVKRMEAERKENPLLGADNDVLWQYESLRWCCLSPLCCSNIKWKVTKRRIDYTAGCCGRVRQTLDLRRVTNMTYSRGLFRGTVYIKADDPTDPELRITAFDAGHLYEKLKPHIGPQHVLAHGHS